MKRSQFLFSALILLSLGSVAAAAEVLEAYAAANAGLVVIHAVPIVGYSETRVQIVNKTKTPVTLGFSSTWFTPVDDEGQRIGLTVTQQDQRKTIEVPPSDERTVIFESRCLDRKRPSPKMGGQLQMAAEPLPSFISKLLRANAPQEVVWRATEGSKAKEWKQMDPRTNVSSEANPKSQSPGGSRVQP